MKSLFQEFLPLKDDAAIASDINVLRNHGVKPENMAKARKLLAQGYSHEEAAKKANKMNESDEPSVYMKPSLEKLAKIASLIREANQLAGELYEDDNGYLRDLQNSISHMFSTIAAYKTEIENPDWTPPTEQE